MGAREDEMFARLALDRGLIILEQLSQARVKQRSLREAGEEVSIARALVVSGFLGEKDAHELMLAAEMQTGGDRRTSASSAEPPSHRPPTGGPPTQGRIPTLKLPAQGPRDPSRNIGAYQIVEKIGEGAMGEVYKTRRAGTDRFFAVKVVSPAKATPDFIARFKREVQVACRLNHANIVRCVEFGYDPWRKSHFYAMHFADGETLGARVERTGPLGEHEAVVTARQVVMALHHAYVNNLVHRDVKPENVMLTSTGRVKLLDLGLARQVTRGPSDLTVAGSFAGSPFYSSPEQARGESDIDIRSDIYSLGATLYYAVAGVPPFGAPDRPSAASREGATVAEVLAGHVRGHIPPPSDSNPDVSDGLCLVITKAMAKDPAERYQTPVEFSLDLDIMLQGIEPVIAKKVPSDSTVERPPPAKGWAMRRRPRSRAGRAKSPVLHRPRETRFGKAGDTHGTRHHVRPEEEDTRRVLPPGARRAKAAELGGRDGTRRPADHVRHPAGEQAHEAVRPLARPAEPEDAGSWDKALPSREAATPGIPAGALSSGEQAHEAAALPGAATHSGEALSVSKGAAASPRRSRFAGGAAQAEVEVPEWAYAAIAAGLRIVEKGPAVVAFLVLVAVGLLVILICSLVSLPDDELLPHTGAARPRRGRDHDVVRTSRKAPAKAIGIPAEAVEFGGHSYKFFSQARTWREAKKLCEKRGGHLVTIGSEAENGLVGSLMKDGAPAWIGLTDERHEGEFEWITGEPVTFRAWSRGEPDNAGGAEHCGELRQTNKRNRWNDARCERTTGFICEWDRAPPWPRPEGLAAEYFADLEFKKSVLRRIDRSVDFDWGERSPAPDVVPRDRFAVRWRGAVSPPRSGEYVFTTVCDDNARLRVAGALLVDDWPAQHPERATHTKPLRLAAGALYPLELEFREFGGQAVIRLQWRGPGIKRQSIRGANLYQPRPASGSAAGR